MHKPRKKAAIPTLIIFKVMKIGCGAEIMVRITTNFLRWKIQRHKSRQEVNDTLQRTLVGANSTINHEVTVLVMAEMADTDREPSTATTPIGKSSWSKPSLGTVKIWTDRYLTKGNFIGQNRSKHTSSGSPAMSSSNFTMVKCLLRPYQAKKASAECLKGIRG